MKKFIGIVLCLVLLTGCATSHLEDGKESVVEFTEGGISAEDLYEKLKEEYGRDALIDLIDTKLLSDKYESTTEEDNYVNEIVKSMKSQYGDSFLSAIQSMYGISSEKAFKDFVRLSYKKDKWASDYAETQVNDTQIEDYYNTSFVGDITASHILIASKATDDMTDEEKEEKENEALATARSIIDRLNNGESFEDLAREFSDDDSTKDKGGDLGAFNDRSNFDPNFMEAAINLEVGKYSTTPVKSQHGYHIILKTKQEDKPELDKVKDVIKTAVASELKSESGFINKALLALREENGLKITDSDLESKYNEYYGL